MVIGISGASGQLGRLTAELVLKRVDPSDVVLVTRTPEKLDAYAQKGVTVRRGDFDDPGSLREAYAGVDRLLIISGSDVGRRIAQHTAAIEAAKGAGVRHLVYTSILNPSEDNPAVVCPEHRATEEAMQASGLAWTSLRNGIYADLQVPTLEGAIATGQYVHNHGEGTLAYVTRGDCAAVAAAVLTGEGHEGKAYDVTGPELLSGDGIAALAAEVSGSAVEAVPVDDETWAAGLAQHAGMPEEVTQRYATFGRATREGFFATTSTVVEDLTGRPPQHLRELLVAGGDPAGAS